MAPVAPAKRGVSVGASANLPVRGVAVPTSVVRQSLIILGPSRHHYVMILTR
jgi:hypothetical protein